MHKTRACIWKQQIAGQQRMQGNVSFVFQMEYGMIL